MGYFPADIRIETLHDEGAACFERSSGVTHLMDDAATVILEHVIAYPGISEEELLTQLQASFDDDPEVLSGFVDKALALLLQQGLLHLSESPDAHR